VPAEGARSVETGRALPDVVLDGHHRSGGAVRGRHHGGEVTGFFCTR